LPEASGSSGLCVVPEGRFVTVQNISPHFGRLSPLKSYSQDIQSPVPRLAIIRIVI